MDLAARKAGPGDVNVPPTLIASVPHLGAHLILVNEPRVSPEQEAVPWPRPPPHIPAYFCFWLSLCLFLPSSVPLGLLPNPMTLSFTLLFPWELGGSGTGLHIQAAAIVLQSVFVFILLAGGRRGAKG